MKRIICSVLFLTAATGALAQPLAPTLATTGRATPAGSIIVGDLEIYKDTERFYGPMLSDQGPMYRLDVDCDTGLPGNSGRYDHTVQFLLTKVTYPVDTLRSSIVYGTHKYEKPPEKEIFPEIFDIPNKTIIREKLGLNIFPSKGSHARAPVQYQACRDHERLIAHNVYSYLRSISRPLKAGTSF